MACQDCGNSGFAPIDITRNWFPGSPCSDSPSGCNCLEAKNVCYTGINLSCSAINTDDNLETVIQKIDAKICESIGDYSSYTFNCLLTYWGSPITTEATFVNAITLYACSINTNLNTFLNVTFPNYQSTTNTLFTNLTYPQITCVSAGVTTADNITTVLNKYCTKFSQFDVYTDISDVVWNSCQTVTGTPTTLGEAFQLLADQICNISASALPTFNTIGTCLPTPLSSTTSLSDTVNKLITRACETPTWDASNLTWGCIGAPGSNTDIEEAIQSIVAVVNAHTLAFPTFDNGDFVVTPTNGSDPCEGVTISLATPINQDRFVAATAGDASPGTLQSKLVAGTGISLNFGTPTQVTISASGTADAHDVKADSTDTAPGFLDDKINGSTATGISINPTYNGGTQQLDLNLGVDLDALFDALLDRLITDSTLYQKFCEKVANCPSPCSAPTNVQAIAGIIPSTTTTTLP